MKKLIFLIVAIATLTCCTKEAEDILTVSQNELSFTPSESEQVVKITSVADWDCEYQAEWLLVRQQQDQIRVIVEENNTSSQRMDVIKIKVGGTVRKEIKVTQAGAELSVENANLTVESAGETITLQVNSNVQWTVENELEWCAVQKDNDHLTLVVNRNYDMSNRSGVVILKSGAARQEITITQSACEWFESFEMMAVPGGTFYMGAQKNSSESQNYDIDAYQIESPVHEVTLHGYSIGKYEVTQAQWTAAMGTNPSINQGDNLPVENVTWDQVQEFITLLNEKTGLNYRLPTEAEWEFAARGADKSKGYKYSGSPVLNACGWYYSNSNAATHEVGSKDANELGVYDMSGNVREWCNDWFDYYSSSSVDNPQGPSYGSVKVNRGGSWTTPAINCRITYRHTDPANESAQDLGFRLVLVTE